MGGGVGIILARSPAADDATTPPMTRSRSGRIHTPDGSTISGMSGKVSGHFTTKTVRLRGSTGSGTSTPCARRPAQAPAARTSVPQARVVPSAITAPVTRSPSRTREATSPFS